MTDTRVAPPVRRAGPAAVPVRHVEKCMGTVFSFHVVSPGVERIDLLSVLAWLHDVDAMFSPYRRDSQVSAINAGRLSIAAADPEVRQVLEECARFEELTDGYFSARYDHGRLDPSGYVKGWATQTASTMLAAAGSTNHYVNGGGDVVCVGQPAPDRFWRIGVADPHRRGHVLRTVSSPSPVAVATSGLAERGAHIHDPHTGETVTDLASVTVVAADLVTADVYATAAVAMGPQRAAGWLAARPDAHALVVTAEGEVRPTPRWPGARGAVPHHPRG